MCKGPAALQGVTSPSGGYPHYQIRMSKLTLDGSLFHRHVLSSYCVLCPARDIRNRAVKTDLI
jgi:hypothetical protein